MAVTFPAQTHTSAERSGGKSVRLHYLDWLQVLAILGVFLFHATHPFDELGDWIIKNTETTFWLNFFGGFLYPWGMPFFLLMAGAASWFSLRRRTPGRYARERVTRLLFPFIIGAILLTPIQAYYELIHKGWWGGGSLVKFILSAEARTYYYTEFHPLTLGPELFNRVGYHLWFVAFLFAFSLLALPVFTWLKNDSGKRFVASFARLATRRGGSWCSSFRWSWSASPFNGRYPLTTMAGRTLSTTCSFSSPGTSSSLTSGLCEPSAGTGGCT
jgi:fucose 4-O-acetylase-like acetyltransferase